MIFGSLMLLALFAISSSQQVTVCSDASRYFQQPGQGCCSPSGPNNSCSLSDGSILYLDWSGCAEYGYSQYYAASLRLLLVQDKTTCSDFNCGIKVCLTWADQTRTSAFGGILIDTQQAECMYEYAFSLKMMNSTSQLNHTLSPEDQSTNSRKRPNKH